VSVRPIRVAAVDLGATSVRVAVIDLAAARPHVEIVHRVPHALTEHDDGTLRWQWDHIVTEVEWGLRRALEGGPLASIGVDGWAVDYGLLDGQDRLLSPPVSYRDQRTTGWRTLAERIGEQRLYEATGIQLMPINTIFQLAVHDRDELSRARHLLLLPDLLVHHLTGQLGMERSNASTTALLDTSGCDWVPELLDAIDVDVGLFAPLEDAGTHAGDWRGVPVHLVGSHDTASAFLARPGIPEDGTAIVSSGTWVLVGTERPDVDVSPAARMANFSNERGAFGGVRFLKNVMGFWLLERCRSEWGDPPIAELVTAAATVEAQVPVFDATQQRFLAPDDMETEIRAAAGLGPEVGRAAVVRRILGSIAASVSEVLRELAETTGIPVTGLHVVGGGVRMELMNQLLSDTAVVPATVGSAEATALGNGLAQGIALGRFASIDEGRSWIGAGARQLRPGGSFTGVADVGPARSRRG
jgi:rhamnulokinase